MLGYTNGNRGNQYSDRVVADDFGKHRGQQVDERQHEQRAKQRCQGHDVADYGVDQANLVHCDADRQHTEDQGQDAPVDGLVGVLGIQAAGGNYQCGGDHCQPLDRHDLEGGQHHHGQYGGDGNRRLVAAVGAFLYRVEADQLAVVGKLLDLCGSTFDQHDVAELQLEVVQVVLDILVMAMHCQHVNTVARSQVEVAHRTVAVA